MRHTLYVRGLRQVEHTVFAVADGQKTYRDPLANGREMAYASGQQVKRSLLDTFADEIGEARAPVTFYKVLSKGALKDGEPHSACDPSYPDQLIGGWMRAEKRSESSDSRRVRRRAPLSVSAFRPVSPHLARVNTEEALTFDRRDSDPATNKVVVRDAKGNVVSDEALAEFLDENDRELTRLNYLAPQKRAYGLYVYDVAVDMRRLFSVSTADEDPELDAATIEKLRGEGWTEVGHTLVAPEAERERIVPALAYALLHWSITSNQARTFSPMPPLAVALADRADKIATAIRADLDPEAGLSRPSATVVLDSVGEDSLFVTPVARGVLRGVDASANAMDQAQAEIERRLRVYDYEAVAA
ncbi:hypothetical protein RQM47_15835 [Rubrivirga sp. S365]|uniref:hypothetical protein n=1 Tax=Rubrivirga sp. S365 TaxID=3076080 RepID=UPI0028C6AD3B|nr:hypothetical protein [Rubrivirga sp. S365]MDT7858118.1 hypothetical protein [Rubrivirga sp. S365]